MDRVEIFCQQEETQKRLRQLLLEPAATYLAGKLYKYTVFVGALLIMQTILLLLLLAKSSMT